MFSVTIKNKALKGIEKMPQKVQEKMISLVQDLHQKGPIQSSWPNFSKLDKNNYHCHLTYKWVACWKNENNSIEIEVYYAGSRENAPY